MWEMIPASAPSAARIVIGPKVARPTLAVEAPSSIVRARVMRWVKKPLLSW